MPPELLTVALVTVIADLLPMLAVPVSAPSIARIASRSAVSFAQPERSTITLNCADVPAVST